MHHVRYVAASLILLLLVRRALEGMSSVVDWPERVVPVPPPVGSGEHAATSDLLMVPHNLPNGLGLRLSSFV